MDEDTTDAQWAQQEQDEREQRTRELLRSNYRAMDELRGLMRESEQGAKDFRKLFFTHRHN